MVANTAEDEPPLACFLKPAKLDEAVVEEFLAKPQGLLERSGQSTIGLSSDVRALAGSDNRTIKALLELAKTADTQQRAAIGAGLARAAQACIGSAPEYAEYIQSQIADSDISELVVAYQQTVNDIQTAALRLIPGGRPSSVAPIGGAGEALGGQNMAFGSQGVRVEDGTFDIIDNGGYTPIGDNSDPSDTTNTR